MPSGAGEDAVLLLRLLVAAALAATVGWERETAGKSAGLRTHMLVGLAAALYTGLGVLGMERAGAEPGLRADPVRVIQAVALGIGFLGGGAIAAARNEGHPGGLTTAASIWTTAAVGIAAGIGHYVLAAGATLLQFVVLRVLVRFDRSAG
jgi:putative Mg2+ transporter-C (MgtC) family protein